MTPKLYKALLIAVPSVMVGTIVIVPTAIAIAEANHEDPVPPEPPIPPVEKVKITFDAGDGVIEETGQSKLEIEFDKEITWKDVTKKPDCFLAEHSFEGWTLIQGSKETIPDTHIFDGDETIYAIYSDCVHEFDRYWVTENTNSDGSITRTIHGHCSKCGSEDIILNNAELKKLENRVLVKENDTYRLSENSLSYEIQYASSTSIDVYPIYGTYIIYGNRIGSVVAANIHGVHDSNGNMISSLNCFNEESGGAEKIWPAIGTELYCDNMILAGHTDADLTWQGGIQCNHLQCEHCLVTGAQATYCDTCTFLNCDFDSTNVLTKDGSNTDYSVFLYNRYATFHDCNFRTNGKAIKIYNHGSISDSSFEFLRCNFTIVDRVNAKACINVDSTHQLVGSEYQVYVSQCQQIEGYISEPLYVDKSEHTIFYEEPRTE